MHPEHSERRASACLSQLIGKSVLIDTFFKVLFAASDFPYYATYQADSGVFSKSLRNFILSAEGKLSILIKILAVS